MAVRVEQVQPSKSGKALRVMLSGKWYTAFKDSGLDQQVGKYIEAEIEVHDKFGPGIKAWKPVSSAAPQVPPPPSGGLAPASPAAAAPYVREPEYAAPANQDNISPWWAPFMSNMCAHAIQAGLCKRPEDLNMWALKSAQVAVATKEQVK